MDAYVFGILMFVGGLSMLVWSMVAVVYARKKEEAAREDAIQSFRRMEQARRQAESLLHEVQKYVEPEMCRGFDDLVTNLPQSEGGSNPYFYAYARDRLDLAAHSVIEQAESVPITKLVFEQISIHFNGRRFPAWSRGDWVLVPRKAVWR